MKRQTMRFRCDHRSSASSASPLEKATSDGSSLKIEESTMFGGGNNDAIDEDELILCCALCCVNCSLLPTCDCFGCSGKAGFCCINAECCCKPGAPCLTPFVCLGLKCETDGCSVLNAQCHILSLVVTAAIPCNEEVPLAVAVAGLTIFPKCGFCIKQKALKEEMSR